MGFMEWFNQTVAPALGKAVSWLDQNIAKPVGGFAENAAGTLFGDGAKNAVHGLNDAVHQGAGFLENGLNKGQWDLGAAKKAWDQGVGAVGQIGAQAAGAIANPIGTIEGVAGRLINKYTPKSMKPAVDNIRSNPKVQQGLNQLKRRAGGALNSISKRVKT